MILFIAGWICFLALCQSKVVEVNDEGTDGIVCCVEGACPCGSLFKALLHVENNSVINITSSVPLHNLTRIGLVSLNNITIIGNRVTVSCNNSGIFTCLYCSNVVIQGITWDQCGDPNHPNNTFAIGFRVAINISIIECTFQYTKACFVIFLPLSSGFVNVNDSRFLFNQVINLSQCFNGLHGSLFISDGERETIQNAVVSITSSLFYQNGMSDYTKQFLPIPFSATISCSLTALQVLKIYIENSTVSASFGLGGNFILHEISNVIMQVTNMTFSNNSNGGSIVRVIGDSSEAFVRLNSCSYEHNVNGSLKLAILVRNSNVILHKLSVFGNKGGFIDNDELQLDSSNSIGQGSGILMLFFCYSSIINISFCNIQGNSGKSVIYIEDKSIFTQMASIISSNFTNNVESALHISGCIVELGHHIMFMNNSGERGAAIYLTQGSQVIIKENSSLEFVRNTASQGGAIFIELSFGCPPNGSVLTETLNTSTVLFANNSAENAGNSIYFNNPEACAVMNDSLLFRFTYLQPPELAGLPISTSPTKINVCSTTCNDTNSSCQVPNKIMLGQPIDINATVCDYYKHVAGVVQFYVECVNCNDKYRLFSNRILVHNGLFDVTFLAVDADIDIVDDQNVTLNLSSVLSSKYRQLTATVSLELSSCQSGYVFDTNIQQCKCYELSKHVIQCQRDYAEIKYGYWFGIVVFPRRAVSLCPIYYCKYNTHAKTSNGYYKLPEELDGQCSSHRTAVACGECKPGYTLAYDSPDCISTDKCSAGMTVLVVALTILYWIIVVVLVFGLMQCKVSLGYTYGLIYYYSIIDILLGSNLFISDGVFQLVTIVSSFAKLTPQYLGRLCFVQGLSGIDQQFIHYFHAVSIFLLIVVASRAARYFNKITSIVSHCILRVICLLILLSYTSLASTSLQLLRPLYFDDVNGAYVYSSPSIKYFTGRHIAYGIIALLSELFIVIGLPLLLLLQPLLQSRVNLVKIKPLLDKFQESYKDQYRWFAAYYLICRQVIIAIVYVSSFNNSLYYVQTVSIIIVSIHVWIKPYNSNTLNTLDGIVLLTMVLVVNLNSFTFSRSLTVTVVVILMIFPLLLLACLITMICGKRILSVLKCIWNRKKTDDEQEFIPRYVFVMCLVICKPQPSY